MWSNITIPGKPSILMVDASRNLEGWEHEFAERLFGSLQRSGVHFVTSGPQRILETKEIEPYLALEFNVILLFSPGKGEGIPELALMRSHWDWMNMRLAKLRPVLFAAILSKNYDPDTAQQILKAAETFAPLAVAPQAELTPREAGLYMLKFFTELNLHSEENISGKMVWFSSSKARELLRRRRYQGKLGVRC